MKKSIFSMVVFLIAISGFAASYKNNTYQRLADEYKKSTECA